jgi:DNA-directed RNA polymerase specialized sigma24 family protein
MIRPESRDPQLWRLLLPLLDPNPGVAGDKYELIRARLIRLFEWQGHAAADELADRTIDRVADKLASGESVRSDDVYRYFAGVARLVGLEAGRAAERTQRAEQLGLSGPDGDDGDERKARERRLAALDKCLARLSHDNRELVLEYYRDSAGRHIDTRKTLCERLGIPVNALRIRVHRLRKQLEVCVRMRLGTETPS